MEKNVRQQNPLLPECPDILKLGPTPADAFLRAEAEVVKAEQKAVRDEYLELARQEDEQEDGKGVTRRRFVAGGVAPSSCSGFVQVNCGRLPSTAFWASFHSATIVPPEVHAT